jgi:hypothetical protein
VSIVAHAKQSAPAQRIEHVEAITTGEAVNEQGVVAIAHAQAWIAIAPALAVRGNRATAKEPGAITFSA